MSYFNQHKKAFAAAIIAVLAVAAICIFAIGQKHKTNENANNAQTENVGKNTNSAGKSNIGKTAETSESQDGNGGNSAAESPLKEGESLEKLVDDFNTLPEGEEKEKARKRLEEILAEAEKQSPAGSISKEDENGKQQ